MYRALQQGRVGTEIVRNARHLQGDVKGASAATARMVPMSRRNKHLQCMYTLFLK